MFNDLESFVNQTSIDKELAHAIIEIASARKISVKVLCATFYHALMEIIEKSPVALPNSG